MQELQHSAIVPLLERELGPEYGRLFADFEAESSDVRAWYTESDVAPRPLREMSSEEQFELRRRVAAMVTTILAYAERISQDSAQKANFARILRAATIFPSDDLWLAGNQPIIVNWGFQSQVAATVPVRAIEERVVVENRVLPPVAASPALKGMAIAAPERARRRWILFSIPWLIFALLVASCYALLLPACGLLWKGPSVVGLCQSNYQTDLGKDARQLQGLIDQAELQFALYRESCMSKSSADAAPLLPPRQVANRDVEQRLPPNAPRGEVEVSLVWNGHADLDLIVECPDGDKLWHSSPNQRACGGQLLSDINRSEAQLVTDPIEHAAWPSSPDGEFTIKVELYAYHDVPRDTEIGFTVYIRRGQDIRVVDGGRVKGARSIVTSIKTHL